MLTVAAGFDQIDLSQVTLYHTLDLYLQSVFVFHGPASTQNGNHNSSRAQIHIFTAGGRASYPRITVSPSTRFWYAVDSLPKEWQGDDICRALAYGLCKYCDELPTPVKTALNEEGASYRRNMTRPLHISGDEPFTHAHAATMASMLVKVENASAVLNCLEAGFRAESVCAVDIDIVLPPGSIKPPTDSDSDVEDYGLDELSHKYGVYAPLVKLFPASIFTPTSKMQRSPSKASSVGRSTNLSSENKRNLREEMKQLIATEENYVAKMTFLKTEVADEFRTKANRTPTVGTSAVKDNIMRLFPPSLDAVCALSQSFLRAIKEVVENTEATAGSDVDQDATGSGKRSSVISTYVSESSRVVKKDPTGAYAFAQVLLAWFPKFKDCYQDYIRSSQQFPSLISSIMKQRSSFSEELQAVGEQKIKSAVIEPVQRLPRYSLYLDKMVECLPLLHPAISPLLKARDMITAICSLDEPDTQGHQALNRVKNIVDRWPASLKPKGRLIKAIDFVELPPPYHLSIDSTAGTSGILLLFADIIVVCRKNPGCKLTAVGVTAEVDKPSLNSLIASLGASSEGNRFQKDLTLIAWQQLGQVKFTETADGRALCLISHSNMKDSISDYQSLRRTFESNKHVYLLQGAFEGKAHKLLEAIAAVRHEGRYPEEERESNKWEQRHAQINGLGVYAAIFEEGLLTLIDGRQELAPIRIIVDYKRGTKQSPVGHYNVDAIVELEVSEGAAGPSYTFKCDNFAGYVSEETCNELTLKSTLETIIRRLTELNYGIYNPRMATAYVASYMSVLKAIHVITSEDMQAEADQEKAKDKHYRPPSPVKMLSNFLGVGSDSTPREGVSKHKRTPTLSSIPSFLAPSLSRSSSKKILAEVTVATPESSAPTSAYSSFREDPPVVNQMTKLEETFTAYIVALLSRSGNIVGKSLRNRAQADELSVNAIYNSFIEHPSDDRPSSEAPVDVLFSSFEKFLKIAWREQMGPVISLATLRSLQEKADTLVTQEFADCIRGLFGDMAPQNRRAFISIIKLLADLLDACGNDGDRGAMTVAFSELLVATNESHRFISLMDRLVADYDHIFESFSTDNSRAATPNMGSVSSSMRHKYTGSLSSNTSSFRRRWGDMKLFRSNSKRDDNMPSLSRAYSKSSRSVAIGEPLAPGGSLSSASLQRSRSIDTGSHFNTSGRQISRPNSRSDRPTVLGAFEMERPTSSHAASPSRLSTIGQSPPPESTASSKLSKKKRRSSLSDLKSLMASTTLNDSPAPLGSRDLNKTPRSQYGMQSQTPSRLPNNRFSMFTGSPRQKENSGSLATGGLNTLSDRQDDAQKASVDGDTVKITNLWERSTTTTTITSSTPPKPSTHLPSPSQIPRLVSRQLATPPKFGQPAFTNLKQPQPPVQTRKLSGMTTLPAPSASTAKTGPQRFRISSPQKLRERLASEKHSIDETEDGLQAELDKISREMATLSATGSVKQTTARKDDQPSSEIRRLQEQMKAMEARFTAAIADAKSRHEETTRQLETVVAVQHTKIEELAKITREVEGENILLHEKYNENLAKVGKAVRNRGGREDIEALVKDMAAKTDEVKRWRQEVGRLRREAVSLKAVVKGVEVWKAQRQNGQGLNGPV
jgi:hypothetical protein